MIRRVLWSGGIVLLGLLVASGVGRRVLAVTPLPDAAGRTGQTDPTAPPVVPVQTSAPAEDGSIVHVVQPGQTLWDLAVVYGVPLDDLLYINGLARGVTLLPGQTIIIRLAEGQMPPAVHVVQEGESLWSIAAQHGLTLDELLALNDLPRGAIVNPGDELLIRPLEPTVTPTVTPIPVTLPPTETPSPTPTNPPAASLTPTPSPEPATPLATLTATATPSMTVTALPTESPTTRPTRTPSPDPAQPPTSTSSGNARLVLVVAMLLILSLGGVLLVGGLLVIWRSRR